MAERISMNTSLTAELAEFVKSLVDTGRYQSDSEVVRTGLRMLLEHESALTTIKAKIAKGSTQADRGEFVEGEKVFEKIRERSKARKLARK